MIAHPSTTHGNAPVPSRALNKRTMRQALLLFVAPLIAYTLIRPHVASDTLALAIAGAVPVAYSIVVGFTRRRIDPVALVSSVGFALACLVSLLTGGSSLPLKLDEALITFTVGIVVIGAVLIDRPFPIGRLLRVPTATPKTDKVLGTIFGAFLVVHALLHVALAVALSTSSYLLASRIVNWGTIVLGVLALSAYLRRLRPEG